MDLDGQENNDATLFPSEDAADQTSPQYSPKTQLSETHLIVHERVREGTEECSQGEYNGAVRQFKAALKSLRPLASSSTPNVAATVHVLSSLGAVYLKQNRLFQALDALEEATRLINSNPTVEDHFVQNNQGPSLGKLHNNLGTIFGLQGKFDAALEHLNRALEIYQSSNADPMETAHVLYNVGRIYIKCMHYDNAVLVLDACYNIQAQAYPEGSIEMVPALETLGFAQLSSGDDESALCSFSDVLYLYGKIQGPTCEGVARNLYNIGMVREARGQANLALTMFKRSAHMMRHLGIPDNDKRLVCSKRSISNLWQQIYSNEAQRDL